MRSVALSVVLVVLLAVGTATVGAASVAGSASASLATGSDTAGQPVVPFSADDRPALQSTSELRQTSGPAVESSLRPSTTFTINLQSDQSAEWVITLEYELDTQAEREAFEEIAASFEDGSTRGGIDIGLYRNIAGLSSERTDRQMEIERVGRSSSRQGTLGTLELSFTWTEFLEADGEKLVFNDALKTPENSTWLTSLGEGQELRITTPRGYAITSANVGFSDNTVAISGPYTFDSDDHVRIILEPASGPSWELLGAAVVVASAIIGGALLLRRQDEIIDDQPPTAANGGVETAGTAADQTPADTATDNSGDDSDPDLGPDPVPNEDLSLLADDERVVRLLERNGGRMRQADIVTETNWSDAKVSQLLSSMADDGVIEKLRIGRENLISLPDVDALDGSSVGSDDDADDSNTN
jgi:flagellar basal body-associated protein FliL